MLEQNYNGVTLAYIGDAVIELYLREVLVSFGITDTGRLSSAAQKLVCAPTQSALTEKLLPLLTPEEEAAYRLGRNHRANGRPKHATVAEYSRATGLEAVFGFLHLKGQHERATELLRTIYESPLADLRSKI